MEIEFESKTSKLFISKEYLQQQDIGSLGLFSYSSWYCLSLPNNNCCNKRDGEWPVS